MVIDIKMITVRLRTMAVDLKRIPVRLGAMTADFKRTTVRLGAMTTDFEGGSNKDFIGPAECQFKFRFLLSISK
jgi:hypothetical protein